MPHVLLIEDDARIREIVERGLGSRGFVVTSAEDGLAGLDLARKLEVDVVLLDLMLPGLSGLEVLEGIRLAKPRLPVVALTALDDTRSKVAGLDAGADDYLTKPFSLEELAARVRARLPLLPPGGARAGGSLGRLETVKAAAAVLAGSLLFFVGVLTGAGRREPVPPPRAIPLGVSNPAPGTAPATPNRTAKRPSTTTSKPPTATS